MADPFLPPLSHSFLLVLPACSPFSVNFISQKKKKKKQGPFRTLGPLRNTDIAEVTGALGAAAVVIILTLGLTIYGAATFQVRGGERDTRVWPSFFDAPF